MPMRDGECVYYQLSKCQKGTRCQYYHRPLEPDICRSALFQKCKYQLNPRQCGKRHIRCQDLPLPSQVEMDRVKQVKIDAKEEENQSESDEDFSTFHSESTYGQNIVRQTSRKPTAALGCFDCGLQVRSPWELKEHVESKDHHQVLKQLTLGGVKPRGVSDNFSAWCTQCNVQINSSSQREHHNNGGFHESMTASLNKVKLAIATGRGL